MTTITKCDTLKLKAHGKSVCSFEDRINGKPRKYPYRHLCLSTITCSYQMEVVIS